MQVNATTKINQKKKRKLNNYLRSIINGVNVNLILQINRVDKPIKLHYIAHVIVINGELISSFSNTSLEDTKKSKLTNLN